MDRANRWMEAKQINALNGWIKIDAQDDDTFLMTSQTMTAEAGMELIEQEIELQYKDMVELRAMIWDAMRRHGRGFEFSVDDVLKIEEVRHKGRYSVSGYEEEIEWTIDLLRKHLRRIEGWKETPAQDRGAYGKLDEFLSQLEELPRSVLIKAHQDGWKHGAADAKEHKEYDRAVAESANDAWDKRYAAGYDEGFREIATEDEPPTR